MPAAGFSGSLALIFFLPVGAGFLEGLMKVSDVMTRDVEVISPQQTIREAASRMASLDVGALPVADNDRLVGMITDRDIVVRAIAGGQGPDAPVQQAMSTDVKYVFEDQSLDEVSRNMADLQVRRLPVVSRDKRLVGILSLGDLAVKPDDPDDAGEALRGVSQPGGERSQSADKRRPAH
jgi:CBS domain-containing protein